MTQSNAFYMPDDIPIMNKDDFPELIPLLPVRNTVLFPNSALPLTIGRASSLRLLDQINQGLMKFLGVIAQRDPETEDPQGIDLYSVGTLGVCSKQIKTKEGNIVIIVQGVKRFRVLEHVNTHPFLIVRVEYLEDIIPPMDESRKEALSRNMEGLFQKILKFSPQQSQDFVTIVQSLDKLGPKADFVASVLPNISVVLRQEILETLDIWKRAERLQLDMTREVEILELKSKIQSQVQDEVGKKQREYYLREQLRAIQKELGEGEEGSKELEDLEKGIEEAGLPEEALKEAMRELKRLPQMSTASAEFTVTKTYLDWIVSLPWNKFSQAEIDLLNAATILNRDHYGLEKIKNRILEYLAVLKLKTEGKAPILCFVGPPGVGKTSLGKSIANALGRKFVRFSLGGIRDEAEIRGHRRTYIGSLPGQIIQGIRRAGERNPVFMLDEVDKIGTDFRGDPASALLEVLDPQQNYSFRDHYLDVPFDLSRVFFITTANILDTIPPALLDRMEVIQLSGYTEDEKVKIAEKYLIPRQIEENGLFNAQYFEITSGAVKELIRRYTRESGLRNLEREIGRLCRKRARLLVEGNAQLIQVESDQLSQWLGVAPFHMEEEVEERVTVPGVAVGLAWTPTGGEILFVEATRMSGKREMTMTGQLGNVMQESVKAAFAWIRSHAAELDISDELLNQSDIHLHIPAGAIPKDGPSAGVTMVTTIVSLLTGRRCKPCVAMTGEITLTGKVLPVGGIKEKVLAAHRAGIREVILPRENEKNFQEDLPAEIVETLKPVFIRNVSEVLELALGLKVGPKARL
jgi:ATP-dependent Lon protease